MRRLHAVLIGLSVLAVGWMAAETVEVVLRRAPLVAGGAAERVFFPWERQAPPPACEVRDFDYVSYLRSLHAGISYAKKSLAAIRAGHDQTKLAAARAAHLAKKVEALERLEAVVRLQVESDGVSYSCLQPGYNVLLQEAAYPSFQLVDEERQARLVLSFCEDRLTTVSWMDWIGKAMGPLALLVVPLVTVWADRKWGSSSNRK